VDQTIPLILAVLFAFYGLGFVHWSMKHLMRQGFLLHGGKRLVQLVPMVDDNHQYQWVLKNTLQHDQPVSVGLQSVLFVRTVA
jgi:hypothetical protein